MAYLTKYTFSKLCGKISIKNDLDLDFFLENIYNDASLFFIFNKQEIKFLFNYKNLLNDEENFIVEYYKEVPEKEDYKNYVFEKAGKLKYHLYNTCGFINNDFVDYPIPQEIKELGNDAINEFRNWFKSKGYAELHQNHKLDKAKVIFDYNLYFPSRFNVKPLNESYKLIEEIPNSNIVESKDHFNHQTFQANLKHLKLLYDNLFQCSVSRTLSKFQYLLNKPDNEIEKKMTEIFSNVFVKNYGLKKIKEKLKNSKSIKCELMQNLIDYFKWSYNFQGKSFNKISLEQFGLICCDSCLKKFQNEEFQNLK